MQSEVDEYMRESHTIHDGGRHLDVSLVTGERKDASEKWKTPKENHWFLYTMLEFKGCRSEPASSHEAPAF
jgi:hypothetical protein